MKKIIPRLLVREVGISFLTINIDVIMKSFCATTLVASLCLVMLGCTEAGLVDVEPENAANSALQPTRAMKLTPSSVKYVPYIEKGSLMPTTDPQADMGVECEEGEFEIFLRKDGHATHLGKIYGFDNSCVNATTFATRVKGINIGANGDSFFYDSLCLFSSPTDFTCELIVTGGTGRFENASSPPGEPIQVVGTFDPATSTSKFKNTGRISSVGSSK